MSGKIVIGGGTGFIGSYIAPRLRDMGYEIFIVSRHGSDGGHLISWDDSDALAKAVDNSVVVINLAGKSVDCRYTEENKAKILSSRVDTTHAIGEAILKSENPPELWINASTATIYQDSRDRPMTEAEGKIGEGFSVEIAKQWEKALFDFDLPKTRRAALRIAIALGNGGGVIPPSKNLVKFGLGGKQADGQQMFSWIHIEDLFQVIVFLMEHKDLSGPINTVAPDPVTNEVFMRTLREKMHMPIGLPAAKWMLDIGAFVIRTETELLLKSRWVVPEKLQQHGFTFKYPKLDDALEQIVESGKKK